MYSLSVSNYIENPDKMVSLDLLGRKYDVKIREKSEEISITFLLNESIEKTVVFPANFVRDLTIYEAVSMAIVQTGRIYLGGSRGG